MANIHGGGGEGVEGKGDHPGLYGTMAIICKDTVVIVCMGCYYFNCISHISIHSHSCMYNKLFHDEIVVLMKSRCLQ